jgi:hypothetical protein
MNTSEYCEKTGRCRFEDSFSLPENQRRNPEDSFVMEREKALLEKWHQKNDFETLKTISK